VRARVPDLVAQRPTCRVRVPVPDLAAQRPTCRAGVRVPDLVVLRRMCRVRVPVPDLVAQAPALAACAWGPAGSRDDATAAWRRAQNVQLPWSLSTKPCRLAVLSPWLCAKSLTSMQATSVSRTPHVS
jgi:hypothetical protein